MPSYIVIRLVPASPVDGGTFANDLNGLSIQAFDLSYNSPTQGQPVGPAATYIAPTLPPPFTTSPPTYISPPVFDAADGIAQQFDTAIGPPVLYGPVAVATAVLQVTTPTSFENLRIVMTRNGQTLPVPDAYYNVQLYTGGAPSPDQFQDIAVTTLYLSVPHVPLSGTGVGLALPSDGSAPAFDDVVRAITGILSIDPGGAAPALAGLTAAQCLNIANEILWSSPNPLPAPPDALENLYNDPPNTGVPGDQNEQNRQQFEGALKSYYATNDANALRLAQYVFAAAAAFQCQNLSQGTPNPVTQVQFEVPVNAGQLSNAPLGEVEVLLVSSPPGSALPVSFGVPATYFYALGTSLPTQVNAAQRYSLATGDTPEHTLSQLTGAIDSGVISDSVNATETGFGVSPDINPAQAVRRLGALGVVSSDALTPCPVTPAVATIILDWLDYGLDWPDATQHTIDQFWSSEASAQPTDMLDLVLNALTEGYSPAPAVSLADLIRTNLNYTAGSHPPAPVTTVAELAQALTTDWIAFFTHPTGGLTTSQLLPPFTGGGSDQARISAFIRHVQQFFTVLPPAPPAQFTADAGPMPLTLPLPSADFLSQGIAAYVALSGAAYTLGSGFNAATLASACAEVFPGDDAAQTWLEQVLTTLDALAALVNPLTLSGPDPAALRFSIMEGLHARGFTRPAQIQSLSLEGFQAGLTGTVAYDYASTLYATAGGVGGPPPSAPGSFVPVNPGDLVNCVPPPCRSPLGAIEYLHELLQLAATASCADPAAVPAAGQTTLGDAVSARRGPLAQLLASCANLEIPLPLIDLVNENLESLVTTLPAPAQGAIYNTDGEHLAGVTLCPVRCCPPENAPEGQGCHDPLEMYRTLPAWSSPAVPVAIPQAYTLLENDFSAADLPYSQPLDISRGYLTHLHTGRYAALRHFRREITAFVHDPALPAPIFQTQLWRYPLSSDLVAEYLCFTPQAFSTLFGGDNTIQPWQLFGYATRGKGDTAWTQSITAVSHFLECTGLEYCDLVALQQSGLVTFKVRSGDSDEGQLPRCPPCYPERLILDFGAAAQGALTRLALFIRIWRTLRCRGTTPLSFNDLADIASVLLPGGGAPDSDFMRQLAALLLLHEVFHLSLGRHDDMAAPVSGADRLRLLALWVGPSAKHWHWALHQVLHGVCHVAEHHHCGHPHTPELIRLLIDNLDPLSRLAGFDPATPNLTWSFQPTSTLRFVEVLAKLCASDFSVGEVLYLFTADRHPEGEDDFPLQAANAALEHPLTLPDDQAERSLAALRHALLNLTVDEETVSHWTWRRIEASLQNEFGYAPSPGADPLLDLGRHFFPKTLESEGLSIAPDDRRFSVSLSGSNALMWNTPVGGPFSYDAIGGVLSVQIPLADGAVIDKLANLRPLASLAEREAVQNVYMLPRLMLAPFAFLFEDFSAAEQHLIEDPDETSRWTWFQAQFARTRARCQAIARHLAQHIGEITGQAHGAHIHQAWTILQNLFADENFATAPWENDAGTLPPVTWHPAPNGSAFAALLGLAGVGLVGEYRVNEKTVWREIRGPLSAFDTVRNRTNSPQPTVVPALDLTLSAKALQSVSLHNGYALDDRSGQLLGGASGFSVRFSGVLLVDEPGEYRFLAGAPTAEGEAPDFECAETHHWRMTLQRGLRTWEVLTHQWMDQQEHCEPGLYLISGAYPITLEFSQAALHPAHCECGEAPLHTGIQIKYRGPDSRHCWQTLPLARLFVEKKDAPLAQGIDFPEDSRARDFLQTLYHSSLRDIRRTYQRAFKALLFAARFQLSAQRYADDGQSELGYWLANPQLFAGVSYYPGPGGYVRHAADFDFDFLPLRDDYLPPDPAIDDRVSPSLQREQALFDWWERVFDYTRMRAATHRAKQRPAWLLFHEAQEQQPADPALLLRHIGADLSHAQALLNVYDLAANARYTLTSADLEDDRWVVRVWHSERWMDELTRHFEPRDVESAQPALWASFDPSTILSGASVSGNANLVNWVQTGEFAHGAPRRYQALRRLNDCLREHARDALVQYLLQNNRVPLPWGGYATRPADLSDLLLIDVEAGCCEQASRIDDAISAVQMFMRRARLGLEPGWQVNADFAHLWEKQFAAFALWKRCKLRVLYRENDFEWQAWGHAERIEAFRFLTDQLRRRALSIAEPGGLVYWPDDRPVGHPSLSDLQRREPALLRSVSPAREGFGLQGLPGRDGRLSWLAPVADQQSAPPPGQTGSTVSTQVNHAATALAAASVTPALPFWLEAADKLGGRFLRIAAAGEALAGHGFVPVTHDAPTVCCACCGRIHPALTDEYYFWLEAGKRFSEPAVVNPPDADPHDYQYGYQDDYYDADQQEATLWQNPDQLPSLLDWQAQPTVRLMWTRRHAGEFQPPRASDGCVPVSSIAAADLVFTGRTDDSLSFSVSGAETLPAGYPAGSFWGFRYDMACDHALTLSLVAAPAPVGVSYPGGLPAYPFFLFGEPGAPLYPPSLYSPAMAVAHALRADCRFEAALRWLRQVFDPLGQDNTWVQCPNAVSQGKQSDNADTAPTPQPVVHIGEPGAGGCCNSTGASDAVALNRSVLLNVLDTMAQWAQTQMRKAAPEAFQQARLLLDTMNRILGPMPPTVLAADPGNTQTVGGFTPDFAPINPRLMALYEIVADRLALIRCCENSRRLRNGLPDCDMPYFACATPLEGWIPSYDPCLEAAEGCYLPSPYRFEFLLAKAQLAAARVKELGATLLAAYEKGDAEYLAAMRARFETELLELNLTVRQDQWRDADWQIEALQETKEISQTNLLYYTNLINRGLIPDEVQYQNLTTTAMVTRAAGNIVEAIGETMKIIPDLFVGFPCEETQLPVGTKLAGIFESAARIINVVADIENSTASLDLTNAGWDRRLTEWIHQTQVLPIEIRQIERQILGAQQRRDQAMRELNAQQRQIEQSAEALDFLRDKFTADSLYLFMQKELNALFFESYKLALHIAHQAEHAFNLERGHTHRHFVGDDDFNSFKEGLLAGERLEWQLSRMDQAWHDENVREYELTKHFSLRLHFPTAYLRLRATGHCEIELPEWMFDADYPGMFMRRIRNISLTLPCIAGPYSGVHCKLTLLSSITRIDPRIRPPAHHCCDDRRDCCDYDYCSDDPRLVRQYAARAAIATSGGQNDSGLFELNFHDDRYLPFEYQGAVSRWRIELPQDNNTFDLDTLSDLVLHLNYTAREGGEALRCEARHCADRHLPAGGWSVFEVRHEFSSAWAVFQRKDCDEETSRNLDLDLTRNRFPWLPGSAGLIMTDIAVLFETAEEAPRAHHDVDWAWLNPRCGEDDIEYSCIQCVASAEWPCLYQGVLSVPPRPLIPGECLPNRLRFACADLKVKRMFVLYRYRRDQCEERCFMPPDCTCACSRCNPCGYCHGETTERV